MTAGRRPFALVPLVAFTANRKMMGKLVNRRLTNIARAWWPR